MSKKIFIQVKHHSGQTGKFGIEQISEVLKDKKYEGYYGCLITSGFVSYETRQFTLNNNIDVIDGEKLVELIIYNLDKLSSDTKRVLGICSVPSIVEIG